MQVVRPSAWSSAVIPGQHIGRGHLCPKEPLFQFSSLQHFNLYLNFSGLRAAPSTASSLGLSHVPPKEFPLPSPPSAFLPSPLCRSASTREEGETFAGRGQGKIEEIAWDPAFKQTEREGFNQHRRKCPKSFSEKFPQVPDLCEKRKETVTGEVMAGGQARHASLFPI